MAIFQIAYCWWITIYWLFAERTLELIYHFSEEPSFAHDSNQVDYCTNEFELQLSIKNLHTAKQKVAFTPRHSILPADLF